LRRGLAPPQPRIDVNRLIGLGWPKSEKIAGYRHITDAHLLAVARRHGASLATLDRGIATLARGHDVVVVPVP
jgi:predicted nucleic acid-binding protein